MDFDNIYGLPQLYADESEEEIPKRTYMKRIRRSYEDPRVRFKDLWYLLNFSNFRHFFSDSDLLLA